MFSKLFFRMALSLLSLSSLSFAAGSPSSSTWARGSGPGNTTLSLNVPNNSSDSLFFHFNSPGAETWWAFGFGNQMAGALIFVMYTGADGKSITVSPRLGLGHVMPQHTSDVTITLLEGSGMVNGGYVVNAMCTGCRSWNGGSLDITSTKANMIYAIGPAGHLQSDDLNESINQHQIEGSFTLNLQQATGLAGVPGSGATSSGSTGSSSGPPDGPPDGPPSDLVFRIHATLLAFSFLIVFPAGYLFLRVFEKVVLHWVTQSFAMVLVIAGIAIGIAASKKKQIYPNIDQPHQIIGIIILLLVISTWSIGMAAHQVFKRTGSPAKFMVGHRVLGPLTMGLGLINVCTGFHLAGKTRPIIGFLIFTALMIIFVTLAVILARRRKMRRQAMNTPAAMNFREGQAQEGMGGMQHGQPQQVTPAIPLQTYQPKGPNVSGGYVQ